MSNCSESGQALDIALQLVLGYRDNSDSLESIANPFIEGVSSVEEKTERMGRICSALVMMSGQLLNVIEDISPEFVEKWITGIHEIVETAE